jgi:hypothetical protein
MIMIPVVTLKAIEVEAGQRGMTVAQLLGKAIHEYIVNHPVGSVGSNESIGPIESQGGK